MTIRPGQILLSASILLLVLLLSMTQLLAQTTASDIRRAWDGHPDLNGIWQALGTANWNLEDHPAGPGPGSRRMVFEIPVGRA